MPYETLVSVVIYRSTIIPLWVGSAFFRPQLLHCLAFFVRRNDGDRDMGVVNDLLTDTSNKRSANHSKTAAPHYNLLNSLLLCQFADDITWFTFCFYWQCVPNLWEIRESVAVILVPVTFNLFFFRSFNRLFTFPRLFRFFFILNLLYLDVHLILTCFLCYFLFSVLPLIFTSIPPVDNWYLKHFFLRPFTNYFLHISFTLAASHFCLNFSTSSSTLFQCAWTIFSAASSELSLPT